MRALAVLLFSLFLLAPGIAALVGVRAETFENRSAAPFPEWRTESGLDRDAWTAVGLWLKDALPLRSTAITVDSWIDYRVFGDSPNPEVLIGEDGELFLTGSLRWPCTPDAATGRVLQDLDQWAGVLRTGGIDLFVVLSPNKSFLYEAALPAPATELARCAAERRQRLRATLATRTDFVFVDVWSAFEREYAAGRRLFPRLGRHWDPYAGLVQTRTLVEAIRPGLWDPTAVENWGPAPHVAELPRRFMNLEIPEPLPWETFGVERAGVESTRTRIPIGEDGTEVVHTRTTSGGLDLVPGETVIISDSFFQHSAASFDAYVASAHTLQWQAMADHRAANAQRVAAADRVILQMVEDHRGFALAPTRSITRAIRAELRRKGGRQSKRRGKRS